MLRDNYKEQQSLVAFTQLIDIGFFSKQKLLRLHPQRKTDRQKGRAWGGEGACILHRTRIINEILEIILHFRKRN